MDQKSLLCGKVINVFGREFLVRQSDGKNRRVSTDDKTYGNGKPQKGELVLGWVDEKGHASVLTRAVQVPLNT